ncbi:MAG: hypothetical protein R3A13_08575 [Bdellovibrionota bacterium]
MREKEILFDIEGKKLVAGCFAELLDSANGMIAGPYKYGGPYCGGHLWTIGDQDIISIELDRGRFRLLDWKRWKKKRYYFDRFYSYLDDYRSIQSAA